MSEKNSGYYRGLPFYLYSTDGLPREIKEPIGSVRPPMNNYSELIVEAREWLKIHRQADETIRTRTAYYLLDYMRASQVEVAAALLADLPEGVDLAGINPHTVELAERFSKVFTLKQIENENSDLHTLCYRVWRCIAECSDAMDRAAFGHLGNEDAEERTRQIIRWDEVAVRIWKKYHPYLVYMALGLKHRTLLLLHIFKYAPLLSLGYRITGSKSDIGKFSKLYGRYFQFDEYRRKPEELLIGHHHLSNEAFVRLMDCIKDDLRYDNLEIWPILPFSGTLIPPRKYSQGCSIWVQLLEKALSRETLIDPAKEILPTESTEDPEEEMKRVFPYLQALAKGKNRPCLTPKNLIKPLRVKGKKKRQINKKED